MKHVYIAGPFTAESRWLCELNVREAEAMAFVVASIGAVPVCPHSMYHNFDGTLSAEYWYDATASLLDRCDAVLLLHSWELSTGAKAERERAEKQGIPVFLTVPDVVKWLATCGS